MKCKYCNGTGEHINDANRMTTCEFCGGTGEFDPNEVDRFNAVDFIKVMEMVKKPLTNEEWRRTCSAEDFAKFLEDVTSSCYHCGMTDDISQCAFQKHQCNIKEWLKEKHE